MTQSESDPLARLYDPTFKLLQLLHIQLAVPCRVDPGPPRLGEQGGEEGGAAEQEITLFKPIRRPCGQENEPLDTPASGLLLHVVQHAVTTPAAPVWKSGHIKRVFKQLAMVWYGV